MAPKRETFLCRHSFVHSSWCRLISGEQLQQQEGLEPAGLTKRVGRLV